MAKHFQIDTGGTLTTSLVSYYKMESDSTDFFGANNGTDTASPTYSSGNGKVNNGVGITSSQKISLGTSVGQFGTGDFSVAFWWKGSTNAAVNDTLITNSDYTGDSAWEFHRNGSGTGLTFGRDANFTTEVNGSVNVFNNAWHLIIGVRSSGTISLYIDNASDGTPVPSITGSVSSGNATQIAIDIGNNYHGVGDFDEIGFWSKALSSQERTDLYNSGSGQTMVSNTAFTKTLSDSIMNGASRSSTVARAFNGARAVSASIMNSASRFATVTGARVLIRAMTDSLMNAVGRSATVQTVIHTVTHVVASLSDSMMNARGRLTIMKGYVNGLLTQFTSKYTAQGTSFSDKYTKQNTDFEDKYQ